jgi:RNA recognition motif-containing protein
LNHVTFFLSEQNMSRRVYAGNLNFELKDAELRAAFARVGGVEEAVVVKDRWTGRSRGFGFVEMMTVEDAEAAIGELDGTEVMGRVLRVALAKPREHTVNRSQEATNKSL